MRIGGGFPDEVPFKYPENPDGRTFSANGNFLNQMAVLLDEFLNPKLFADEKLNVFNDLVLKTTWAQALRCFHSSTLIRTVRYLRRQR